MTPVRRRFAAIAVLLGVSLLCFASNPSVPDRYKHHVYVADAWLHGRLSIEGYPAYYHDWITVQGEVHSPFAPAPAILLVPFVWWWGTDFNMNAFSMGLAGVNAMLCWLLLGRVGAGPRAAALGTLIFAFGTVNWYTAIIGTTWFLAHLCVELFLLLALLEIFGRARPIRIGIALGMAVLSRANVVTALPALLLLLVDRRAHRGGWRRFLDGRALATAVLVGIGLALPAAVELWLNWARFGNPLDTGYGAAAEIYMSNREHGWYDWRYLPRHLYVLLFKGWDYVEGLPYLKPSPEGLSVVLTSPVLFYAFAASWHDRTTRLLWLATALTFAALFPYFYQGWVQFGYRYLLDALPYVIVLAAVGMRGRAVVPLVALSVFSVLSNALGVAWGRHLGW